MLEISSTAQNYLVSFDWLRTGAEHTSRPFIDSYTYTDNDPHVRFSTIIFHRFLAFQLEDHPCTNQNRLWGAPDYKRRAPVQSRLVLRAHFCSSATIREHVYDKEFIVTVHSFHQFEKVEWNKLVGAEIKSRKYVLGQRRKSPSNERQTDEFSSPELIHNSWSQVNIKTPHFQHI